MNNGEGGKRNNKHVEQKGVRMPVERITVREAGTVRLQRCPRAEEYTSAFAMDKLGIV